MKRSSSDDLETIRRALADVWATQGRKFVTFEPESPQAGGAAAWIQYLDGEVNVAWPTDDDPAVALARDGVRLPASAFCAWHAAGSNAVFDMGDARLEDVARFVAALAARFVAVRGRGPLVARVDDHR